MPTELLFRDDAYLRSADATVLAVNDRRGIVLDRTVFYATGGGQPGDTGTIERDGAPITIATTVYGDGKVDVVHVPGDADPLPEVGETVRAVLDWERRHRHMRIHTGLHLLSVVLPFPVTGGSIGATSAKTLESGVGEIDASAEAARKVRRDVIVLCHGGPIAMPDDAEFILKRAKSCNGFYGASSMERLPVEIALAEQTRKFKSIQF